MGQDDMVRLAGAQHGVIARWQMRAIGLADDTARARIRTGQWVALTDEVLVRVGSHAGRGQRVMAAVLDAGPGAVLSFQSGAAWYRVPGAQLDHLQLLTTVRSRRRSSLSRVHVVRELPPTWTTVLEHVPVARPELIALHLFATEPFGRAERWVERMWSMRLLSGPSVGGFLSAMGKRGRNGTAALRTYLDARPAGYTPSATGVELRARTVLSDVGFTVRAQVDSGDESWTGRVDLRDAVLPLILEVQSAMYHDALVDQAADQVRLAQLRRDGFAVVEVTDTVVFHDPAELVRRYRAGAVEARQLRMVHDARPDPCSVPPNQKDPSGSAEQNGRENGKEARESGGRETAGEHHREAG